ncbi:hypothetical protein [Pseudomonas serbica]|uniref:hypothetical protein n=1 Tax=Pseudomonas serbica TaxID=2965074 RepID=UPI00237B9494|nr:hypothetical protein [Pseudomonas serbica]
MQSPERVAELNTIEDYKRLLSLVASDHVYLYRASNTDENADSEFKDPHLRFSVNCSDTFYYACSDFTEFDLTDTADLTEMFDKFGTTGLIAWCARDRNEKPLKELIDDKYNEAFAYAAKFYAPEYDYILLCSNEQKLALEEILSGISYTSEIIDEDKLHLGYKVRLTETQHLDVYNLVTSMYRVYDLARIKECKFRYFNGYSVYSTRKIVAKLLGLTYDINKGYIAPMAEVVQA